MNSLVLKLEYEDKYLKTSVIMTNIDKIKNNYNYENCETTVDPTRDDLSSKEFEKLIENVQISDLISKLNSSENKLYYVIFI